MFTDVTDQRAALTALRERDRHLQGLFSAAPMAIISLDGKSNVITWNKGAETLFGWAAEEIVGHPLPVIPDEQRGTFDDARHRMRAGEVVRNMESRRIRKDGSIFESSSNAAGVFDDQGELTGHIVFVEDITARKLAEEALTASEAKFRSLFEVAGDAIVIHDPQGSILELNQAACALMGATRKELVGRTPPYLAAASANSGDQNFFESLHRHSDGSLTAIEVNTRQFIFGGRAAALSLIRDVSARKQTEEELRQANESLRTIIQTSPAAIVSRDTAARVLTWNRGAELLFGYTADEAIGTTLPFLEGQEQELLQAILGRIGAGDSLSGFEHQTKHRDGRALQISISTAPFHDPDGNIAGEIAIVLDVSPRNQALATLRESETRFRAVFEQPAAGMALCNFEGLLVHFNDRFCQITGYTRDELLGKLVMDITHPDDRPVEAELAESLLREEVSTYSFEKRYVRPDGSTVWVNLTASLMRDPDGNPTEVFGVVEDISARKEAESGQKLLTDTISASHDEIYLFDAETLRFRFVNQGGLSNLGYTFEQMARFTPLDITASYTPESLRAMLQPLLNGELPLLVIETVHVRADGTTYPVEVHLQVFSRDGDRVFLAVIQDTTARRHTEQVLRESEARFRQVVECAPEAIFVVTAFKFRYLNPNAIRLFGASSEQDLIGSPVFDRIHPDWRATVAERLHAIFTQGAAAPPLEEVYVRLDGSAFDVEVAKVPFNYEGQPAALIFFRDISERKRQQQENQRLEEMLRQAQKMESIGRLAGGVAHDFNNHLTVINGFSELVLDQIGHDSPLHQPVSEIRKSGERAAAITRQLLAFSRKQILDPQSMNLNALIRDLSNMLRRLLGEDIAFRIHLEPGLGAIVADSSQMSQILMNLCVNARDAMPHGGSLTITTSAGLTAAGRPAVNLSISDSGGGIDEATLPRIFEPFFTTKDPGVGTGLGLATVHGIVEQSGGAIRVESVVGAGTTFYLTFPAIAITPTPASPDASAPARGTETILLVEDQFEVRLLARALLIRQGYHVLEAASGEEALALAASCQDRISLLVTDVIMPGCTGPELARRFSETRPGIPILFMSGYDAGSLAPDAAHIAKPFTPNAFVNRIRQLIDAAPPQVNGR
ncbi:MAG: PAS domain S-box protein [Bryobacterales bacterium]|nr:PAS domain S-box protein [Bryobacterales bacterium]